MVTAQKDNQIGGFLKWLQIPNNRAEVSLDTLFMAAGGVLVPLGLARLFASAPLGLVVGEARPGPVPMFLAAFISVGLAAALLFVSKLAVLRPAGLTAVATAAVLLAESASRIGDSPKGGIGLAVFMVLSIGLALVPPTRHQFFLGAVLYSSWRLVVLLTSVDFQLNFITTMDPRVNGDFGGVAAGLSVFLAAGCLGAVWFLDRKNAHGLSLPFAVVGIVIAAAVVSSAPNFFVSLLAFALAGAAVWVGSSLSRRGVAWAGAVGLVLSAAKLYDGFGNRFAGLATLFVGVGILAFAGRSLLPGVAKAVNGLASNKAVIPDGAQPGPGYPAAVPMNVDGAAPQNLDGSGQGFGQPAPGGFSQPAAGGFVQPATGTPDVDLTSPFAVANEQTTNFQSGTPHQFQPQPQVEGAGVAEPGADIVTGATAKMPHAAERFETEQPTAKQPTTEQLETEQPRTEQLETIVDSTTSVEAEQLVSESGGTQVMEPNWYADPTERYDHRWHDGVNWTEHVATAGNSAIDPIR